MNKQKLISAYIIDDNREAIKVLARMLEKNYSVEVVGEDTDAESAIKGVIEKEPDIIFLDVELPSMSGLEFCTLIRNEVKPETKVIFYTGHDKYMLEAIRREAFDYLLKPASEQELSQIMTRYYENKLAGIPQATLRENIHLPVILVVNSRNEHLTMRLEDIAFFRYNQDRKLWEVICNNHTTYILRHRTTADVILNYSPDFVQIHKRYIVNINQIKMIQDATCILAEPLEELRELKISKNYRRDLMAAFYSL
ncbi:MAG: response regulator transcription factor [Prevotella sp.]|nr:response regulator transcription factor [Prevotella sp.]